MFITFLINLAWTTLVLVALACIFLKFTFVEEGTAKIVMQFGAFHKVLLSKRGYALNDDGDIVREEEIVDGEIPWHLPGGLRFVGIRWVHTIYEMHILASVDYQYKLEFKSTEDANLLPLSDQMTLTTKIINPYKALFSVKNWFDALITRVLPRVREYISLYSYEDIISRNNIQLDNDVFKKLNESGKDGSLSIVEELKRKYGIVLIALETVNISPPPGYREATLSKWQAARDAEKRLGTTTGTLMAMIADQTGLELKDIKAEFGADPDSALKKYEGLIKMNKDFIEQQIASDAGSLRRYYFQGGTGGMDLIALLGDVFRGSSSGEGPPLPPFKKRNPPSDSANILKPIQQEGENPFGGEKGKKKTSEMTEDEKQAAYEKLKTGERKK
jgi:regulator of protease activity HflC (stomatin/prohibitin superfamily)